MKTLNENATSACLVINHITVDNLAALFNCTPVDRASDYHGPGLKLLGPELFNMLLGPWGAQLMTFASDFQCCC